ncbi:MAG: hypothetical protein DRJ05_19055, partial [Bacteroidetes bacterium]
NWVAPSANYRKFKVAKIEYFNDALYVAGHYTDTVDIATVYFDFDFYLVKYNSVSGDTDWVFEYNRALYNDWVYDFVIDKNSIAFYLCGVTDGISSSNDMSVVKIDAAGNLVWDVHYTGTASGSNDGIRAGAIDNAGNIYVTGFSQEASGGQDYTTIKYNYSGDLMWRIHYLGGHCLANAICLDNNNDVIITGFTTPSMASSQFRTVKYTQTTTGVSVNSENFTNIKVFPNPSSGLIDLNIESINNDILKVEIISIDGQKVYSKEFENIDNIIHEKIDLSGRRSGLYLIKVYSNKIFKSKKLIIN